MNRPVSKMMKGSPVTDYLVGLNDFYEEPTWVLVKIIYPLIKPLVRQFTGM